MGEEYNNSHRAFLQAFLSRSTMTFEEAQPVLAAIFSAHGVWNTFLPIAPGWKDV